MSKSKATSLTRSPLVKRKLPEVVSPEGYEPHVLFAGDTARPVVLWAPRGADLSALDVVLEEGA